MKFQAISDLAWDRAKISLHNLGGENRANKRKAAKELLFEGPVERPRNAEDGLNKEKADVAMGATEEKSSRCDAAANTSEILFALASKLFSRF